MERVCEQVVGRDVGCAGEEWDVMAQGKRVDLKEKRSDQM